MLGCSLIITEYDEQQSQFPQDCTVLHRDLYGDGEELDFVVRFHTEGSIKRTLERIYIHHECTHGILVVVPCNPTICHFLEEHDTPDEETMDSLVRTPLDMVLVKLLVEEERSFQRAMGHMMTGYNHRNHHHQED